MQMTEMHVNVWDKTLNFFHFLFGGGGADKKQIGFPFFFFLTCKLVFNAEHSFFPQ